MADMKEAKKSTLWLKLQFALSLLLLGALLYWLGWKFSLGFFSFLALIAFGMKLQEKSPRWRARTEAAFSLLSAAAVIAILLVMCSGPPSGCSRSEAEAGNC